MEKVDFIYEKEFNKDLKEFYTNEWPTANKEVFNFTDQTKWKMEEHLITARIDNEIFGVSQFRIIGGVGYLSTLLVKEEYRGKGLIGKKLLSQFENIASEKKCHKLSLKSYKDSRSSDFFANNDYCIEGILKNDIHGIDWVIMAKFL